MKRLVAAALKEAAGVLLADRSKRFYGGLEERFQGSCLRLPDEVLHLGEGLLYGVEVRRVARQKPQLASPLLDEAPDPPAFVCTDRLSIRTICPGRRLGAKVFLT